jgi:acyl carrier protein
VDKKLTDIITAVMCTPASKLTSETTLDDLGCDSLDKMEILMRLDEESAGDTTMEAYESIKTLGDLERLVSGGKKQ